MPGVLQLSRRHSNETSSDPPFERTASHYVKPRMGARGIFLSAGTIQRYTRLKHDERYIRRPPIAQHRLGKIGRDQVEYLAKDTRNKQFVLRRYPKAEFIT